MFHVAYRAVHNRLHVLHVQADEGDFKYGDLSPLLVMDRAEETVYSNKGVEEGGETRIRYVVPATKVQRSEEVHNVQVLPGATNLLLCARSLAAPAHVPVQRRDVSNGGTQWAIRDESTRDRRTQVLPIRGDGDFHDAQDAQGGQQNVQGVWVGGREGFAGQAVHAQSYRMQATLVTFLRDPWQDIRVQCDPIHLEHGKRYAYDEKKSPDWQEIKVPESSCASVRAQLNTHLNPEQLARYIEVCAGREATT